MFSFLKHIWGIVFAFIFTGSAQSLPDFVKDYGRVVVYSSKQEYPQTLFENTCTIYEITDKIDLDGKTIEVPANCVLYFNGGSLGNGTLKGNNTKIIAGVNKIFNESLSTSGSWDLTEVYPEWYGAKGDGKTDDTESIRRAIKMASNGKIIFQNKTYIINVTAGEDNSEQRIVFPGFRCAEMIGDGAVIKLGDKDNCNLYVHKGFVALFSVYSIESFYVSGITFDFNYVNNPIYQTLGKRQDIQENTQQNAFQFRRVRKVVIENCSFIGHSGTNCIDYNDARYDVGDKIFEFTVRNCRFLECGGKSYYKADNSFVDAYHDCSTIAVHYRGKNHETKYLVNIVDNTFEGVGGNAYNVIETDASSLFFYGNTMNRFVSGIFPCASIYDGDIVIEDNKFQNISRAIVLWLRSGTNEDSDRYGFRNVSVLNNECTIDMGYWVAQPRYDNIGVNESNRYGFILTTAANDKSVKNLTVSKNTVRYKNFRKIDSKYCSKACLSFESVDGQVKMMKCEKLTVSENRFYNLVNRVLHNSMFQEIDTFVFSGNYIYHPFSVVAASSSDGGGVIYLNASKAFAPSLDYPKVNSFIANNNRVVYNGYSNNDGCAVIINSTLVGQLNISKNSLVVKNNTCSSKPQYGFVRFVALNSLFKTVDIDKSN